MPGTSAMGSAKPSAAPTEVQPQQTGEGRRAEAPAREVSTTAYLLILIAAVVIPLFAFATFLLVWFAGAERARLEETVAEKARQVALIVDSEMIGLASLLKGLAASYSLASNNLAQFHAEARAIALAHDAVIVLRERGTRQLLNTQVDYGTELPPAPPMMEYEQNRLDSHEPLVSRVYRSPISRETRVAVAIAAAIGDRKDYVLAITVPTTRVRSVLLSAAGPEWLLTAADQEGVIVARTERHEEFTGTPGRPDYLEKMVGESGWFEAITFDGRPILAGYYRSRLSGWQFGANILREQFEAPLRRSFVALGGLGALALILSAVAAYRFGRSFTDAAAELAVRARSIGKELSLPPMRSRIREFAAAGHALEAASAEISERTHELRAVLGTVPVAVLFTYDKQGRTIILNGYAAELLKAEVIAPGPFGTIEASLGHIRMMQADRPIETGKLPLQRALRGDRVNEEEFVCEFPDGSSRVLLMSAIELRDGDGQIVGAVGAGLDITDRRKVERQRELLVHELNHRVKNALAIAQAISVQTLRSAASIEQARHAVGDRLVALAKAHDVLTNESWAGANLEDIVINTTMPHGGAERFHIAGPSVWCPPSLSLSLSLALNELATNAIKYGSLSVPDGRVLISWTAAESGGRLRLALRWEEKDGPPARPPRQNGFGTKVIQRSMSAEEDGKVTFDYAESGLICVLEANIPIAERARRGRFQVD